MSDDLQGDTPEEMTESGAVENGIQTDQDGVQKAINKKHFQFKQAERERDAEREAREKLQRELDAIKAANAPKGIPPIPDPLDDDYEQKVRERDAAIEAKTRADEANRQAQEAQRLANERAQQATLEEQQKVLQAYTDRASALGVKPEELQVAGSQVADYGVSPDFAGYLMGHEEGPLIVKHLAADLAELDHINSLTPYQQGIYVENHIRPKLQALKPKTTEAPNPPTNISGGGVDPEAGKFRYSAGATFE